MDNNTKKSSTKQSIKYTLLGVGITLGILSIFTMWKTSESEEVKLARKVDIILDNIVNKYKVVGTGGGYKIILK